ncbi:MAG TPA: nuclear transport factor 2 family protein [Pyrinomonadaceae bacterium]|nr:nuclear transport factor 2 family protein [Pyrinomonadaceae bacterium]
MKHILSIVLLITLAASPTHAQAERKATPAARSVERQLIELEHQLSDALVKEDAAVLDRLWSNDLVFTFPNGKVSNKAQRLAGQKPSAQSSQSTNSNDQVKVYLYGNTAVVTVLSTWKGKAGTQEYSDQYQTTHVWVKQQGRWQLVAAHVSQVKK